jgi:hypothetical protein
MGQTNEQGFVVPFQPAIKSSKVTTFEGEQETNCHQFTRPQAGLAVFRYWTQAIIDQAEQMDDKIFCSLGSLLSLWLRYQKCRAMP